uniref:Uncharacterized protein n=1 Tax=Pongo abelii TaxID=9601 RepID=A0A8I5T8Y4_PONAB
MIRKTTQRPTEKTAAPRHPFFIGSWPEPVSCGGIFSPCFGQPQNCDPGVVTLDKILSKSVAGRGGWGYVPGVKILPIGQETSLSDAGSAPAFGGRPLYSQDLR